MVLKTFRRNLKHFIKKAVLEPLYLQPSVEKHRNLRINRKKCIVSKLDEASRRHANGENNVLFSLLPSLLFVFLLSVAEEFHMRMVIVSWSPLPSQYI